MRRVLPRAAALALCLVLGLPGTPSPAQQGPRPAAKPAAEKGVPEKPGTQTVIACPSLANYRLLTREGPASAARVLADPKADHLGCAALPRGRITGVTERVALAGRSYDCLGVQGTTACHWTEPGDAPAAR